MPATLAATPDDQAWFDAFRIGVWPDYFPGVQFPRDPASLEQFFRQITPDTGPFDREVVANAVVALFEKIGPGILLTHSKGGGVGWLTAVKNDKVRAIVSYEPGTNFLFPEGEVPPPVASASGALSALAVPMQEFKRLTRIPIALVYGDYIPEQATALRGQDQWRIRVAMARQWVAAINRHGGDATFVSLPELGLHGNTHFPFSDLNNIAVADELSKFLASRGLDI